MTGLCPPAEMAEWTKERPPILCDSNHSVLTPTSTGHGYVKSLIGHADSVAGAAGLLKVIQRQSWSQERAPMLRESDRNVQTPTSAWPIYSAQPSSSIRLGVVGTFLLERLRIPILTPSVKSKIQVLPSHTRDSRAEQIKLPAGDGVVEHVVGSNKDSTSVLLEQDRILLKTDPDCPSQPDVRYTVSNELKFIGGAVFKTLWSEPRGSPASGACELCSQKADTKGTENEYGAFFKLGEQEWTSHRRLVVDTTMSESFDGSAPYPLVGHRLLNALPFIHSCLQNPQKTEVILTIHLSFVTLSYAHQELVVIPAYTVALPWPRKPPWSKNTHSSINAYRKLTIETSLDLLLLCKQISTMIDKKMTEPMDTASHWSVSSPCVTDWVTTFDPELSDQTINPTSDFNSLALQEFRYVPNLVECEPATNLVSTPRGAKRSYGILDNGTSAIVHGRKYQRRDKDSSRNRVAPKPKPKPFPSIDSNCASSVGTAIQDEEEPKKRLACPFFKHDQIKYGKEKACIGSWPDISRLKEHIHRRHVLAEYLCNRCLINCEDYSQLNEHLRSDPPCSVKARDSIHDDMLDYLQVEEIKKRPRGGSVVEKWNKLYHIIFRLSPDTQIPSPFYENIMLGANAQDREPDTLSQFEDHLRRQLTEENAAEIQTCLGYIQRFLQTAQGSSTSHSASEYGSQSGSEFPSMYSDSCEAQSQPSSNPDTDSDYSSLLRGINVDVPDEFELGAEAFTQNFDMLFGVSANIGDGNS